MATATESQTTKALEWVVERITTVSQNGNWMDRLTAVASSRPAYLTPAGGSAARAGGDAGNRASRADAAVAQLSARVADLEAQVAGLNQRHETLALHLEEAVGPHSEGEHKTHWWSRKGH